MPKRTELSALAAGLVPILLALLFTTVVLSASGASPVEAYGNMLAGALGSPERIADVFVAWTPLCLCAAGLLVTFTAGLWNIGVEGQIILGAIFTTWVARTLDLPVPLLVPVLLVAGAVGGALWGLLVGGLQASG